MAALNWWFGEHMCAGHCMSSTKKLCSQYKTKSKITNGQLLFSQVTSAPIKVCSLEQSKPELMHWSYTSAGLAQEYCWDSWDVISGLVS